MLKRCPERLLNVLCTFNSGVPGRRPKNGVSLYNITLLLKSGEKYRVKSSILDVGQGSEYVS